MTRRTHVTRALVLAAGLSLVAACAPSNNSLLDEAAEGRYGNGGSNGVVTLRVAYYGDFGIRDLVTKYEKLTPGVKVEIVESENNAHHTALQDQLIANTGAPDIAAVDVDKIVSMREQSDKFVNLLSHGADQYEDDYLDWKWAQSLSPDGSTQIGLGTDVGPMAMCYRRDLLKDAGLEHRRDKLSALWGDSWEDFIEFGEKYVDKTGKGFIDDALNIMNPTLGQQEVGFFTADEKLAMEGGPKVAFDTALAAIEAGLSANLASWTPEWDEGFDNGDFAVIACPAWLTGQIRDKAPERAGDWDIADIPGRGGNWGGAFWTIPAQSEYIDEAYALLTWLIAAEQQIEVFNTVGSLPSQPALYSNPAIVEKKDPYFNDAPTGAIFAESARSISPQYIGRAAAEVRVDVENVLRAVQKGDIKPRDAWAEAVARATATATAPVETTEDETVTP